MVIGGGADWADGEYDYLWLIVGPPPQHICSVWHHGRSFILSPCKALICYIFGRTNCLSWTGNIPLSANPRETGLLGFKHTRSQNDKSTSSKHTTIIIQINQFGWLKQVLQITPKRINKVRVRDWVWTGQDTSTPTFKEKNTQVTRGMCVW